MSDEKKDEIRWTWEDEVNFITSLGTHSAPGIRASKWELLEKYTESLKMRVKWGDINQIALTRYLNEFRKGLMLQGRVA